MPARIDAKLDKIIHQRFSASFMSNAKWRELFTLLDRPELHIDQAYWKFIDNEQEVRGWFTKADELMEKFVGDYGLGPFAYKRIEWIEIPAKGIPHGFEQIPFKHWQQDTDSALRLLTEAGEFEVEKTDRGIRIYGFK